MDSPPWWVRCASTILCGSFTTVVGWVRILHLAMGSERILHLAVWLVGSATCDGTHRIVEDSDGTLAVLKMGGVRWVWAVVRCVN